jgi:hypothetical protein
MKEVRDRGKNEKRNKQARNLERNKGEKRKWKEKRYLVAHFSRNCLFTKHFIPSFFSLITIINSNLILMKKRGNSTCIAA